MSTTTKTMSPDEFLEALNRDGSDFVDAVTSEPGYKEDLSLFLPLDSSDFFMEIEGELCFFCLDAVGGYFDMKKIESKPVYYWEESMLGDVADVSIEDFEAELNNLVPGLFVRQESCGPTANQNDFTDYFSEEIQRIWDEALANV